MEYWRDITRYEKLYQVSTYGRIRRIRGYRCLTTHFLKPGHTEKGYQYVNLWKNNKPKTYCVHTLVLNVFIGLKSTDQQCRHLDGDKENNNITNLQWGTSLENQQDRIRHGTSNRGQQSAAAKLTNEDVKQIRFLLTTKSLQQIADQFGVHRRTISDVKNRKTWRHI